jgi:hypothetical protein
MMRRRQEKSLHNEEAVFSSGSDNDDDSDDPLATPKPAVIDVLKLIPTGPSPRLHAVLRKWLRFYVTFLQASPFHQDRLLKALQWTAWLASVSIGAHTNTARAAPILQKISTDLSFARYATRLLEWPVAIQAALTGCWTTTAVVGGSSSQALFNWFGRALSWSMVGYYPAEYAAYMLWMLPPSWQTADRSRVAAKMSAWSCRCWFVYLVTDLVQSVILYQKHEKRRIEQKNEETDDAMIANSQQARHLKLQAIRSALFLLPCIHWSLPHWDTKPWLSSKTVNGLMWVEAMVSLYQTAMALPVSDEHEE